MLFQSTKDFQCVFVEFEEHIMKFKRRKSKKTNPDHTGLDLEVLSLLWDSDETYSDKSKFILKHFSTDPVKATAV